MQHAANVILVVGGVDDLRQIRQSLQQAKVRNRLHHVGDAVEARAYLRQEGPYPEAPSPVLVLLDASLPRQSAIDLITELKTNAQLAGIPVIILLGSESEHRLTEDCLFRVDGSIQKPFDVPELIRELHSVDALSFLLVKSPPAK